MIFKYIKNFILFLILVFVLSGCAVNKNKSFKIDKKKFLKNFIILTKLKNLSKFDKIKFLHLRIKL